MRNYETMFSLQGKKALIAGASRGIGLAIAQAAAAHGAHAVLAARSTAALEREAAALAAQGYSAAALALDIADPDSVDKAAEACSDADILVNVAGTNIRKRFEDYTAEEYERIMQTNLHGIVRLTRNLGKRMIARGAGGKIVNIGSLMSLLGLPHLSIYAMTKSALAGLTRAPGRGVGGARHSGQLHRSRIHSYRPEPRDVAAAGNGRVAQGARSPIRGSASRTTSPGWRSFCRARRRTISRGRSSPPTAATRQPPAGPLPPSRYRFSAGMFTIDKGRGRPPHISRCR